MCRCDDFVMMKRIAFALPQAHVCVHTAKGSVICVHQDAITQSTFSSILLSL